MLRGITGLALCMGGGMIGSVTKDECLVGGVFVCVGVLRFSLSLHCLCLFVCVFFYVTSFSVLSSLCIFVSVFCLCFLLCVPVCVCV